MELNDKTIDDAQCTPEGGIIPPHTGLTPDVLPEVSAPQATENSPAGVSTKNTLTPSTPSSIPLRNDHQLHWYALRATYGRAKASYDYLVEQGLEAYHPTIQVYRMVQGKRRKVEESRLPNIFFARSTEHKLKTFVYDNVNLPHLRFYYRRFGVGPDARREPLIVPDAQMNSLKIICGHAEADNILLPPDDHHFEKGDTVIVTGGDFQGVIGKVARYCGQLRVAVIIDGLLTIATAYVPRGYLKKVE